MKILLFGGSFDPPHVGHQNLMAAGLRAVKPDRAFVIPAWRSPLKARHSAQAADRRRMAGILVSRLDQGIRVTVDPFEIKRGKATYTYETLRHFRREFPGAELWFLAGTDSAATIGQWRRPKEVRSSCRWLLGRRPGVPVPSGFDARMLPGFFPDVSSTLLRAKLYTDEDASALAPKPVLAYIRKHGLYGGLIRDELQRTLRPGRYEHTLAVSRWALELAVLHGIDPEAAALAGLLHDAGRRFDPAEMARYVRFHGLAVPRRDAVLRNAPMLSHAYISEDLARRSFGVTNPEILSAVRHHTLGAPGMPPLDRLLYVADISSHDRPHAEAAGIRRIARKNLDKAFVEAVRTKLRYTESEGKWIHPGTRLLWDWAKRAL